MTSMPLVSRTFATLRIAEFGFFGVRVITWIQTPRRNGFESSAGDLDFALMTFRPLRTNWLMVGISYRTSFGKRGGKYHPIVVNQVLNWSFQNRYWNHRNQMMSSVYQALRVCEILQFLTLDTVEADPLNGSAPIDKNS